jgi:hypothetical protein
VIAAVSRDPLIALVVAAALAVLLASAAFHKLRDLPAFRAVLEAYRLLPEGLSAALAPAIAAVELAFALALAVPAWRAAGAIGTVILLTLYSGAIAINLARGRREIDCGCGAPGTRQPLSAWLLGRNALLASATLLLLVPAAVVRPLLWLDWLGLAGSLAVLTCAWLASHRLLAAAARVPALGDAR